ncbi:NLI interacting factor-like phosphatase family protein, putative [Ichthyophthirius multifiliis]|uniref:NLI interacting factor-like phosphatase family protein, putative n=1 Tax=Ichthyophthirius multifiliis TaxID=5932 RepID=G0R1T9_ICHMU|nr:NLI interacting factor-like phosphatase family protein, putative [Ichthyophthirius multifiliis]EGR28591.1 NLI interacting factor-like phosphatase family protein, putative [Ichthyophthirius multifiliis]|eukprot:XP_004029827.1 NLI interacting factor-like phosphatase family protein, putative [Ichthyophthirius multifiliis]
MIKKRINKKVKNKIVYNQIKQYINQMEIINKFSILIIQNKNNLFKKQNNKHFFKNFAVVYLKHSYINKNYQKKIIQNQQLKIRIIQNMKKQCKLDHKKSITKAKRHQYQIQMKLLYIVLFKKQILMILKYRFQYKIFRLQYMLKKDLEQNIFQIKLVNYMNQLYIQLAQQIMLILCVIQQIKNKQYVIDYSEKIALFIMECLSKIQQKQEETQKIQLLLIIQKPHFYFNLKMQYKQLIFSKIKVIANYLDFYLFFIFQVMQKQKNIKYYKINRQMMQDQPKCGWKNTYNMTKSTIQIQRENINNFLVKNKKIQLQQQFNK